ncbi:MAG: hypothetical protein QM758_29165 [Armatimonas sp.]
MLPQNSLAQTPKTAIPARKFLDSIGANSSISRRGETLEKTIEAVKYTGLGWIRAGYEGDIPIEDLIKLHQATGLKFSYGLGSGGNDIPRLLAGARRLAAEGALVAVEGNNEPNNWGVTYQGEKGGGNEPSWMAVAKLQRDLYAAVKSDPALKTYPVWSISEAGAMRDNVGLQYLTIPPGAKTLLPPGTQFADFVNVHNYIYHPNSSQPMDNKCWNAADPTSACKVDGLYGNHGVTWAKKFPGYTEKELITLPKVTTETGTTIGGPITEDLHGKNLVNMYLAQFARGWSYTDVYILRDRSDEGGNQKFGFFAPDYTPRLAAKYLHNLTTALADKGTVKTPSKLAYSIPNMPATVHDLLLQKSDGTFCLVLWGEKLSGSDMITLRLGKPFRSVAVYDVTSEEKPLVAVQKVDTLALTLSDHPLVVELKV